MKSFTTGIGLIERIDGLAVFLASLFLYSLFGESWGMFIALFLTPDIAFIGYAKSERIGIILYNALHNYGAALMLMVVGVVSNTPFITGYGIILMSHVSFDRFIGFSLKTTTGEISKSGRPSKKLTKR